MAMCRARRKSRLLSERRRKKLPATSHQLKTTGGWQWAWPAAPLAPLATGSLLLLFLPTVLHGEPAAGSTGHSITGWGPSPSARRVGIGRRQERRQEIPPQGEKTQAAVRGGRRRPLHQVVTKHFGHRLKWPLRWSQGLERGAGIRRSPRRAGENGQRVFPFRSVIAVFYLFCRLR